MAGDFSAVRGARLTGGFVISHLEFVDEPFADALGRPALAKTRIVAREFQITLLSRLSDKEKSVSLYHEVLEAMTVGCAEPPIGVLDFNESDFEQAAYEAQERFGPATPEAFNQMLHFHGFREG